MTFDKGLETRLQNVVNKNKPKYMTINKQKFYISRSIIDELKKIISNADQNSSLLENLAIIKNSKNAKEGGILPLIPLLGLIFGGLSAAGGVAGGTAAIVQAVNSNKNEQEKNRIEKERLDLEKHIKEEQDKHNERMWAKLGEGEGIKSGRCYYKGNGFKETFSSFANKAKLSELAMKTLKATLKPLSDKLNIFIEGDGLFLYPKDIIYRKAGEGLYVTQHDISDN
jgi:hypothetical protein